MRTSARLSRSIFFSAPESTDRRLNQGRGSCPELPRQPRRLRQLTPLDLLPSFDLLPHEQKSRWGRSLAHATSACSCWHSQAWLYLYFVQSHHCGSSMQNVSSQSQVIRDPMNIIETSRTPLRCQTTHWAHVTELRYSAPTQACESQPQLSCSPPPNEQYSQ